MSKIIVSCMAAIVGCVAACARVEVTHVNDSDVSDGVHFYEPRPYLLVGVQTVKDAQGKEQNQYTSQIIWLPDHSRRYKVEVKPGWGTVDGSLKLANGWMLTDFGAKSDSKMPETLSAIAGLVKESAALANVPQQGLYRIDIDGDGKVTLARQDGWK
jgi:hypothetical protein